MDPPRPEVERPETIAINPLFPLEEAPLLIAINPETPESALAVWK
jgi:hypothetical protein